MKQGIKTIVALFFILCSFWLGKYSYDEDCKNKSENLEDSLYQLKVENKALKDTVIILIDSISLIHVSKKQIMVPFPHSLASRER
ncbi:hypothetical protein [Runella slithyformis]|uniref:Uncharacterized protein n=1 Tax=Runella slithyformis (strain ATCC 29530 / DSM 19594 / LMG 11500 / NCIMB 11436 / LSU 4) TaxID=761193 RepID=A0A7U3ZH58_RUNSL|nr:hypothetical protein [Runella slithyformis]AEI47080.1 hypothetical protein Runsl_0637 [Runella slithyformis DSM 19594]